MTRNEQSFRRIWFGESCDEWALSPVEGWDEYMLFSEHKAILETAKAAIKSVLWINKCRCHEAYTSRKKHEPNAMCGELDELEECLKELGE